MDDSDRSSGEAMNVKDTPQVFSGVTSGMTTLALRASSPEPGRHRPERISRSAEPAGARNRSRSRSTERSPSAQPNPSMEQRMQSLPRLVTRTASPTRDSRNDPRSPRYMRLVSRRRLSDATGDQRNSIIATTPGTDSRNPHETRASARNLRDATNGRPPLSGRRGPRARPDAPENAATPSQVSGGIRVPQAPKKGSRRPSHCESDSGCAPRVGNAKQDRRNGRYEGEHGEERQDSSVQQDLKYRLRSADHDKAYAAGSAGPGLSEHWQRETRSAAHRRSQAAFQATDTVPGPSNLGVAEGGVSKVATASKTKRSKRQAAKEQCGSRKQGAPSAGRDDSDSQGE